MKILFSTCGRETELAVCHGLSFNYKCSVVEYIWELQEQHAAKYQPGIYIPVSKEVTILP